MRPPRRWTVFSATDSAPGLDVIDRGQYRGSKDWQIADPRLLLIAEDERRVFVERLVAADAIDLDGAVLVPVVANASS